MLFGVSITAAFAVAAIVFVIDLRVPLGISIDALYVAPLLISLLADDRSATLALAVVCTILAVVGHFFSPSMGVPRWIAAYDRLIGVLAMWITAVLGSEMASAKRQIRDVGSLLTICAWTKQVKVDGEWMSIDRYLTERCGVHLTHGISREAAETILRERGLETR
jgi:small-conductance mechanosensitive channel